MADAAEVSDGAVVVARGVRRTFDAETAPVRALRGVDLRVDRAEMVAIVGPSGSGKSTLVHLLAGLDRPDDGSITVAGEVLDGRSDDDLARFRARHVGLVFQFFHLLDAMSALENVALAAMAAGTKRRAAERRAHDLLDLLGIGERANDMPAVLSGGQRQRLSIARALANRPTLLLADEPTGALDAEGGQEVLDLLGRLRSDGQTVVLVTHDPTVAAAADRRLHLRDGRMLEGTRP